MLSLGGGRGSGICKASAFNGLGGKEGIVQGKPPSLHSASAELKSSSLLLLQPKFDHNDRQVRDSGNPRTHCCWRYASTRAGRSLTGSEENGRCFLDFKDDRCS